MTTELKIQPGTKARCKFNFGDCRQNDDKGYGISWNYGVEFQEFSIETEAYSEWQRGAIKYADDELHQLIQQQCGKDATAVITCTRDGKGPYHYAVHVETPPARTGFAITDWDGNPVGQATHTEPKPASSTPEAETQQVAPQANGRPTLDDIERLYVWACDTVVKNHNEGSPECTAESFQSAVATLMIRAERMMLFPPKPSKWEKYVVDLKEKINSKQSLGDLQAPLEFVQKHKGKPEDEGQAFFRLRSTIVTRGVELLNGTTYTEATVHLLMPIIEAWHVDKWITTAEYDKLLPCVRAAERRTLGDVLPTLGAGDVPF